MHELFAALGHHAQVHAKKIACDDGITRLAYGPLASRVAGAAEELATIANFPAVIGLLGGNRVETVIGQLAGWYAGKTLVPLPLLFADEQLAHVIQDAGVEHLLIAPDAVTRADRLGMPYTVISDREASFQPTLVSGGTLVTYTSGTTGRPKGVVLDGNKLIWTAQTLARKIGTGADDVYLSVLPLSYLLETICAILIPILAGARVCFTPDLSFSFQTTGAAVMELARAHRPTCMVLVPEFLRGWVAGLQDTNTMAPDSLRFVAVGGAGTSAALAKQAWQRGIPAYEGYGLSECGSVVSLNVPGERRSGTVGKPLPGCSVQIEDNEIVVQSPAGMNHYLNGPDTRGVWRTGDIGEFDQDGYLVVRGRRDNRIVMQNGRNISPEWIETLLVADHRIATCVVTYSGGSHLGAVVVPTAAGESWFTRASGDEIHDLVSRCCHEAPDFAVPRHLVLLPPQELIRLGLIGRDGAICRAVVRQKWPEFPAGIQLPPGRRRLEQTSRPIPYPPGSDRRRLRTAQ